MIALRSKQRKSFTSKGTNEMDAYAKKLAKTSFYDGAWGYDLYGIGHSKKRNAFRRIERRRARQQMKNDLRREIMRGEW